MERTVDNFGLRLVKGLLVGVSISLAAILVFAFVLKFVDVSAFWIKTINQVVKLASVFFACLVSVRGEKGFIKGAAVGLCVVLVTYLLFGFVSGSISFGIQTVFEVAYGLLSGALAGIICVNLKK